MKTQKQKENFKIDLDLIRKLISEKKPKDKKIENIFTLFIIILSAALFIYLIDLQIPVLIKLLAILILLFISGEILKILKNLDGEFGLIFFKDKRFIEFIENFGIKYQSILVFLIDIGFILCYGLVGAKLIEKKDDKNIRIFLGFVLLLLFSSFVLPFVHQALTSIIFSKDLASASKIVKDSNPFDFDFEFDIDGKKTSINLTTLLMYACVFIFGIAGAVFFSIFVYAIIILKAFIIKIIELVFNFFYFGKISFGNLPPPGAMPIIPGKSIPLFEGLIAFLAILVVHEFFHGFLSSIYKIKVQTTGIVFFGILPIGAFVEPDEKELQKLEKYKQNKILVAGSLGNFYSGIIAFFLFTILIVSTADLRQEGKFVRFYDGNEVRVYSINNISVDEFEQKMANYTLKGNEKFEILTENGLISKNLTASTEFPFVIKTYYKTAQNFDYKYKAGFLFFEFILNTLKLIFSMNIMIGAINLLFVPFFDGNRILENALENKKNILKIIQIITIGSFLINLLPWAFR